MVIKPKSFIFHLSSRSEMFSFLFTLSEGNETCSTGLDFGFSKALRSPYRSLFMVLSVFLYVLNDCM